MGEDLLGMMPAGPKRLNPERKPEVLQIVQDRVAAVRRLYEAAGAVADGSAEYDTAITELNNLLDEHFPALVAERDGDSTEEMAEHLLDLVPEVCLDRLYDLWNHTGEEYFRDCVSRQVREEQVMFCGELSWGGSPGGYGYETLQRSDWLGLHELLGLH